LENITLHQKTLLQILLLNLSDLPSLNDLLDLVFYFFVTLLQLIEFSIEHVHVILKTVILLFRLDESGNYFFNIWNPSRLFDLVKCILNNLNISQVLIHQFPLLFISFTDFVESAFQDYNRIWEIKTLSISIFLHFVKILIIYLNYFVFVLLLESQLVLFDPIAEDKFLLLMSGLESNDLIPHFFSSIGIFLVLNV
jgi:hypothetical protein